VLVELSLMEQRYQAVLAVVQDGWKVVEVADRFGVSRQTVHAAHRALTWGGNAVQHLLDPVPYGDVTFEGAFRNSETLIEAARVAAVSRIVQVSITNPAEDSPFPYFRGKARVEAAGSRLGSALRSHPSNRRVRSGRHPDQQPSVHPSPAPGLRRSGQRFVPPSACLRRGRGGHLCPGRSGRRRPGHRRGRPGDLHVRGAPSNAFVHVPTALTLRAAASIGRLVGDVLATRDELEGLMPSS
jgi:Homeodomain-like domain-containing protein